MPYIDREKIIGWYDAEADHFLCDECFSKKKDIDKKHHEPVMGAGMDTKDMYICDECEERFAG